MARSERGFEDEARQRVIDAARRSGVSVGELVQALADPGRSSPARARRDDDTGLDRRFDDLSDRLRRLAASTAPVAPATPSEPSPRQARTRPAADGGQEAALEEIAATVGRLSRGDEPRGRAAGRRDDETSRILEALEGLDRRVRALTDEPVPRRDARVIPPEPASRRDARVVPPEPASRRDARVTPPEPTSRRGRETAEPRGVVARPSEEPRRDPLAEDLDRRFRELGEKIDLLRPRDDRDTTSTLIAEIRSLRAQVEARAGSGEDVTDEIRRLAARIDALVARRPDREAIEPLVTEIGRLRDVVLQSNVEGSLRSIEAGYGHIVDRLDDLKHGLVGPRIEARLDEEISEIRNLLSAVPQVSHLSTLERRLDDLGGKMERLAARRDEPATQIVERRLADLRTQIEAIDPSTVVRALDQRLKLFADKLDGIERAARGPIAPERLLDLLDELRTLAAGNRTIDEIRSLEGHLVGLSARVADLDRRWPPTTAVAAPDERLHGRIAEIAGKLDRLTASAPTDRLVERIGELAGKLDRLAAPVAPAAPDERLHGRIAEIAGKLDRLAASVAPDDHMEGRIAEIADKLDRLAMSTGPDDRMEDRIAEIAEKLDRLARSIGPDDHMEGRIAEIAEKLDRLAPAAEPDIRLHARVAEIAGKLDRLAVPTEPDDRLHDRIAEIAGKLDRLSDTTDDRRVADALEAAVARLDEVIARAPSTAPAPMLDVADRSAPVLEVEALTREIAAMRSELAAARPNEDLEAQMRLLAERLERSVTQEPDDEALAQIEDQLTRISRQLATTEDRFQDIAALEGHIRRLADRVEDHQIDSVAAAREAAREMVRELGTVRGDASSEAALRALQDDLRSLQSAARDTETRTNDTLISLHDALTGIVGRLAAIEKIAQGSARSAAAARSAAQAAETAAQSVVQAPASVAAPLAARLDDVAAPTSRDDAIQPTIAGKPVAPVAMTAIQRAREMLAASATAEDNRPLEPGSGKPSIRPVGSPLPGVETPTAEPARVAARKADFIAAARRAAQAAVASTEPATAAPAADRAPAADAAASSGGAPSALARIGRALKSNRRPLVLATAAIVLAVLTFQVLPNRGPAVPPQSADAGAARVAEPTPSTAAPAATPSTAATTDGATAPAASMLAKTPNGEPPVGFAMPLATDGAAPSTPMATTPAPAAAPTAAPPQRTGALEAGPTVVRDDAPTTTGSIPPTAPSAPETAAPAPEAAPYLPSAIGSEALRRAAVDGDAKAAFEIGLRFSEGRGVPADAGHAVRWYTRAADKGLAPAQYRLAIAYEKGLGVSRDVEKAKTLYAAAAEQGNMRAMHNLGVLYAGARDMTQAVRWFQKAADLGMRDSQFNLGIVHALGSGVKQDLAVSYKWFALAARQGDAEAEKKLNEITTHLDKVNLAAARMAVQTWVQRPLDPAANDETRLWTEPATAAAPTGSIGRDAVVQAQSLLKSKGLYSGVVDGQASTATRTAVRAFQKKQGLPQTGEIDASLLRALTGRAL